MYAIVLVDWDAPTPANPSDSEYLLWLVTNLHANDLQTGFNGTVVVPYKAPNPFKGKDWLRSAAQMGA